MKQLLSILVTVAIMTPVSGCFVQTRSRGQSVSRDCPPSTHWDDGRCVHNGKGHGHGKHKDKHKGKH